MITQFEDVANQVAQEKIGSQRLRNEAIRKGMDNPWTAPTESITPTPTTTTGVQPIGTGKTLASTYTSLLNNSKSLGLDSISNNNTSPSGKMPSWLPSVAGQGVSILSGNGLYGALANMALQGSSGNWKGAVTTGAGTLTNLFNKGQIPGLGGVVGNLTSGLLNKKSPEDIGINIGNSLIGTGVGLLNPVLGTVYGLARLFGLDPIRGVQDYAKSDYNYATNAGYNGGFFGDRSWNPVAPYNPTGTYSGSGYGNTAGPGSGSNGTPINYTESTQHYGYSNPASSYASNTSYSPSTSESMSTSQSAYSGSGGW